MALSDGDLTLDRFLDELEVIEGPEQAPERLSSCSEAGRSLDQELPEQE